MYCCVLISSPVFSPDLPRTRRKVNPFHPCTFRHMSVSFQWGRTAMENPSRNSQPCDPPNFPYECSLGKTGRAETKSLNHPHTALTETHNTSCDQILKHYSTLLEIHQMTYADVLILFCFTITMGFFYTLA